MRVVFSGDVKKQGFSRGTSSNHPSLFLLGAAHNNFIIVNHRDLHMLDRPVAESIEERDDRHPQWRK
jgi:hypothetical protein